MIKLQAGQHRFTIVHVLDEPGAGGAYHEYEVKNVAPNDTATSKEAPYAVVKFQKGPVTESGVNGIFMEDLLQICRHRLQCFQAGSFACRENALALTKIEEALHWLDHRTKDRQARNVEGTMEK
ncbi:MAG: hypothetical protein RBR41_03235 [Desulfovibrio sp.]|uniref:hypothetical protein n=1 Tax=Desulfovibrio sp. TaxID=885 RepID=UPI002A36332D|nr:hypothetical protein [Desulfovibrio sp.]MDY0258665.1 hypothetical protein [Desulfovibrio sp.]